MDPLTRFGTRSAEGRFLSELNITLETVSNLAFLIHECADQADQVRKYSDLIQQRISTFGRTLKRSQN